MENFKGKNVVKWALSIGIVVVLNLFFSVAIQTFYAEPEYKNFCSQDQVIEVYEDEKSCTGAGGQWNENLARKAVNPAPVGGEPSLQPAGYCNVHYTCALEYEDARDMYARNVFVVLVVLGALSILGGYLVRVSPAVSAGLSYGGVLTFIIAAMRYWDAAGDFIRLGIVAIALIALIVIGIKKFKE